jgi:hypothetical protein
MKKVLLFACFAVVLAGSSMAQFSIQKVVFEEFTGAWCQYCADGAYRAEVMDGNFPDALMIAVHVGDAMDIPEGADTLNNYYAPAFPQAQAQATTKSMPTIAHPATPTKVPATPSSALCTSMSCATTSVVPGASAASSPAP